MLRYIKKQPHRREFFEDGLIDSLMILHSIKNCATALVAIKQREH